MKRDRWRKREGRREGGREGEDEEGNMSKKERKRGVERDWRVQSPIVKKKRKVKT